MSSAMNIAPLLSKGISDNFGMEWKRIPKTFPKFFLMDTMSGRFKVVQGWIPLSVPVQRDPGEGIIQDQFRPDFANTYITANYGKELVLANEDADDDQYGLVVRWCSSRGGQLALAYSTLHEIVAGNLFSVNAFTATSPAPGSPDSKALFSTSHPRSAFDTATTWSNRPTTEANLSMASFQAARANLETQLMANNQSFIANKVARLAVYPDYLEIALQLQKGQWNPGTSDRAMNTVQNTFDVVAWPYFKKSGSTGTNNGWFVQGEMHGLRWITRQDVKFDEDKDVHTNSMIFTSGCRDTCGWDHPLGMYGTPGA